MASLKELLRESRDRQRVWVVGHRGAMGYRPENTMVSFEHAVALGADWIEFDVHLTRDGQVAVIHDETVNRTTNGTGYVKDFSAAELRALDAGAHFERGAFAGQHVPFLDEVLAWASERGVLVDIEVKNAPLYYPGIEQAVVAALDKHGMSERAIVIAFDHATVRRVKALDERVATGVLYAGRPIDPVGLARDAHADALLPHWAYVTPEDVQTAHAAGIGVAPWVTSDPQVIRALAAAGVDAIGTNHPDVARGVLTQPTA